MPHFSQAQSAQAPCPRHLFTVQRRLFLLGGLAALGSRVAAAPKPPSPDPDTPALPGTVPMLATAWQDGLDPTAYWVSEKFDGVRALWDGQQLRFRSGRPMAAPAWFVAVLPPLPLDGELWLGRRRFDALSATVRRSVPDDAAWRAVRYLVFDAPVLDQAFSVRLLRLQQAVAGIAPAGQAWVQAVTQAQLPDARALQARLQAVLAEGGEGLVLHRADGLWQAGRSDVLRKLKPQPDEEATVVGWLPGQGKYAGQTGALWLQTPQGQRFRLGSGLSDALRAKPPPLGTLVSYRYRGRTASGLPQFASFLRLRPAE